MKRNTLVVIVLLFVGMALAVWLGLALQGFARSSIVMPILYAAWMADLIFRSVPGWLWWAWFLIVVTIIALRSLRGRVKSDGPRRVVRPPAEGPVRSWGHRVAMARQGEYFRWRLAHDLAELALQYTAYRDHRGLAKYDRGEFIETLNAPADVQAYFQAGLKAPPWQPLYRLARVTRLWRPVHDHSPLALDPAKAVHFLEEKLERESDD
jgi:hypothetical protein